MDELTEYQRNYYAEKARALSGADKLVAQLVFAISGNKAAAQKIILRVWLGLLSFPIGIRAMGPGEITIGAFGFRNCTAVAFFLTLAVATLYGMNRRVFLAWIKYGLAPFVVTPGEEDQATKREEQARRNVYVFGSVSLLYFFADADFAVIPFLGGAFEKLGGVSANVGLLVLVGFFYYQFIAAVLHQMQLRGGLTPSLPKYLEPSVPHQGLQAALDGQIPITLAACAVAALITRLVY